MSEGDKGDKAKGDKGAMYHCDFCRKDITALIRIRCAVCDDFDLCLECFSSGSEVFPHRNDHAYRVIDHVRTPLFEQNWGADEELLLLEGIEMFGFGNWSDIEAHVGTKTKQQCEEHYFNVYLNSRTAPLPDVENSLPNRKNGEPYPTAAQQSAIDEKNKLNKAKQQKGKARGTVAPVIGKPKPKSGLGHLVGYIPNRGDFDTEYDNDAELILADMEFRDEDTKWERELKLKVLEIYNSKLDARAERKKFILERGLLERREKKRSKEEREVYNNMRVFARFHSPEEHEAFVQGILNEQRLRKRIEQLQEWRLNGIRTLADGDQYEIEKKRRTNAQGVNGQGGAEASGFTGTQPKKMTDVKKEGTKRALEDVAESERVAKAAKKEGARTAGSQEPALADFDVSRMEGADLLSASEVRLCNILQLAPVHYMIVKERLVRECYTRGFLKESQAKQLIKIDINKTARLFDFFVSVGWINPTEGNGQGAATNQKGGKRPALTPSAVTNTTLIKKLKK